MPHARVNAKAEAIREAQRPQEERDAAVRLAAQRQSTIVELEHPNGGRITVQPADVALWRERGWTVVKNPL
jgi:hypothetical protein